MSRKNYATVSASVFTLVALAHLARMVFNWPATIGTFALPTWLSVLAVVVAGLLAYHGFNNNN